MQCVMSLGEDEEAQTPKPLCGRGDLWQLRRNRAGHPPSGVWTPCSALCTPDDFPRPRRVGLL